MHLEAKEHQGLVVITRNQEEARKDFPSGFLTERLLCGGSAILAHVFCKIVLLPVKGGNLSRAVVFIAHVPPPIVSLGSPFVDLELGMGLETKGIQTSLGYGPTGLC